MLDREARAREIMEAIRRVLLLDWDPIGVRDEPLAQDEYDGYVGAVYRLLVSGASEKAIAEHLQSLERVDMGMGERSVASLLPVARKLSSSFALFKG